VLRGIVVETSTARPVPFAELMATEAKEPTRPFLARADSSGHFDLSLPGAGRYTLSARRIGFEALELEPFDLADGDTLTLEIRITPKPGRVDPLVAQSRAERPMYLEGFEHRRQLGIGSFITRDEIVRRGEPALGEMLGQVPGLHIQNFSARGDRGAYAQSSRSSVMRFCQPLMFLDGVRVTRSGDPPTVLQNFLTDLTGNTIEAVEVYVGVSKLPGEFADPDAKCGVIAVWSRKPGNKPQRQRDTTTTAKPSTTSAARRE
jgi:hypothetical protein